MKRFFDTTKATLSRGILFVMGAMMVGLGLMTVGVLALFAVAVAALALIATPFLTANAQSDDAVTC